MLTLTLSLTDCWLLSLYGMSALHNVWCRSGDSNHYSFRPRHANMVYLCIYLQDTIYTHHIMKVYAFHFSLISMSYGVTKKLLYNMTAQDFIQMSHLMFLTI